MQKMARRRVDKRSASTYIEIVMVDALRLSTLRFNRRELIISLQYGKYLYATPVT
ncbi:hypothetical protein [Candidatus Methylobacter oryzae]|uniref:hypothetical protein n=1 Tax=Candidatus Methylobacter oryzae TaxID=2497749 RepID=UPI0012B52249|nr:hypothetical protein [Candidatus Methylobacter oryzae]